MNEFGRPPITTDGSEHPTTILNPPKQTESGEFETTDNKAPLITQQPLVELDTKALGLPSDDHPTTYLSLDRAHPVRENTETNQEIKKIITNLQKAKADYDSAIKEFNRQKNRQQLVESFESMNSTRTKLIGLLRQEKIMLLGEPEQLANDIRLTEDSDRATLWGVLRTMSSEDRIKEYLSRYSVADQSYYAPTDLDAFMALQRSELNNFTEEMLKKYPSYKTGTQVAFGHQITSREQQERLREIYYKCLEIKSQNGSFDIEKVAKTCSDYNMPLSNQNSRNLFKKLLENIK